MTRPEVMETRDGSDPELVSEILSLTKTMRKFKIYNMMKSVLVQERHDRELASQKEKLS